jgi:hypothetical protein
VSATTRRSFFFDRQVKPVPSHERTPRRIGHGSSTLVPRRILYTPDDQGSVTRICPRQSDLHDKTLRLTGRRSEGRNGNLIPDYTLV